MSTSELSLSQHRADIKEEEDENLENEDLNAVLVAYDDDHLDECVKSVLKKKSRVRFKCFDIFLNFIAFGTSSGAIYLFKLESIAHSSCELLSMIPCDQGSIEVIKFLPNPQTDDLSVVIGTIRGSIVVFKLTQSPDGQSLTYDEIYTAESFSSNSSIKLIESDNDKLDSTSFFSKLYICDSANRLYALDSSTIYTSKQALRLFTYNSRLPTLLFSISDSNINQICVYKSQVLVSTDETTRLFNEYTNKLQIIGKKKRKEGFYGACFFNPNYKPIRIVQIDQSSNQTRSSAYSSRSSINELENVIIFVARPMFRLWQVNHDLSVLFTHQFESLIKSFKYDKLVRLKNEPIDSSTSDDPSNLIDQFTESESSLRGKQLECNHFCKLIQIYSSTLGNLILSYSKSEIFVVDPTAARLITFYHQDDPIIQVSCHENELFVWSLITNDEQQTFQLKRILLLAPTQFVLELHRTHRYLTLMAFVELFADLFRRRMALPLSRMNVITTEGGLLRNVLLNAWDVCQAVDEKDSWDTNREKDSSHHEFSRIIEEIVEESKMLKHSLENITDSRFFLTMTDENIDRLCAEPYASLVSLEVSIADLHTNHVIHFNQDALNRHKSVANLSENIRNNVSKAKQGAKSSFDLRISNTPILDNDISSEKDNFDNSKVIVERKFPKRPNQFKGVTKLESVPGLQDTNGDGKTRGGETGVIFEHSEPNSDLSEEVQEQSSDSGDLGSPQRQKSDSDEVIKEPLRRCTNCRWPLPRSHLYPLDETQESQVKWLEENLLGNFEENISEIEKIAFEHSLWLLFLRCLAFQNRLDDYIICCMLLDDIRVIEIDQFVITRGDEVEVIDCLLKNLDHKIQVQEESQHSHGEITSKLKCLKCKSEIEIHDSNDGSSLSSTGSEDCSLNLHNLLEHLLMRRHANIRRMVSQVLRYPGVLNSAKIPVSFYLKAIEMADRRLVR